MESVPRGAPFADRGGWARGVVDLVAGRYPRFLFGLGTGPLLPVFHFHHVTPDTLEPALHYLAENGYHTLTSADVSAFVRANAPLPRRAVMLAFDDALASLWLVAAPLLKRFGLRAVTYAIPARMTEAAAVRPTIDDGPVDAAAADRATQRFVTWPELKAVAASGVIDVQSHTWSHTMMFSSETPMDVVRSGAVSDDVLSWPRLNDTDPPAFLDPQTQAGYPLFPAQSRMSAGRRFVPDAAACDAVVRHVAEQGGQAFFERASWRRELEPLLTRVKGRSEGDTERERAMTHELVAARETLEARLGTRVRHVCLPWGVTSPLARRLLERLGFETAFANRLAGVFGVRAGDDPFFLKRLSSRHIFALPGRGRRPFVTLA